MIAFFGMFVTGAITAWMIWAVFQQLRSGQASVPWMFRWPTIRRAEQPVRYWMTIAGETLSAFAVGFFTLVLALAVVGASSN